MMISRLSVLFGLVGLTIAGQPKDYEPAQDIESANRPGYGLDGFYKTPSETNAYRMARGLPPYPPRVPSSAEVARRAPRVSSVVLNPELTGRLEIRNAQGDSLGYIVDLADSTFSISGLAAAAGLDSTDVKVKFTPNKTSIQPFSILSTNPQFPEPFYIGAASSSSGDSANLKTNDTTILSFTNVEQTTPLATARASLKNTSVESAIWFYNSITKELTAQWINADGTKLPTFLAYSLDKNALIFVSNPETYNEVNFNSPASVVKLYLAADS